MDYRPVIASRLARTGFGQKALAQDPDLEVFKQRPSPRVKWGLLIMGLSFLIPWPSMALVAYLAYLWEQPWALLAGAAVVVVVAHLVFVAGVLVAGGNYLLSLLRWAAARFIRKYHPPA